MEKNQLTVFNRMEPIFILKIIVITDTCVKILKVGRPIFTFTAF